MQTTSSGRLPGIKNSETSEASRASGLKHDTPSEIPFCISTVNNAIPLLFSVTLQKLKLCLVHHLPQIARFLHDITSG